MKIHFEGDLKKEEGTLLLVSEIHFPIWQNNNGYSLRINGLLNKNDQMSLEQGSQVCTSNEELLYTEEGGRNVSRVQL